MDSTARDVGAAIGLLAAGALALLTAVAAAADAPASASTANTAPVAQGDAIAVSLTADAQGRLWLARVRDGRVIISHAPDAGGRFGNETVVNADAEAIRAENQNRPKIAVHGDTVVVLWAQALAKRFSGHVRFARSVDAGRRFGPVQTINDNRDEIGHGFPTLAMNSAGRLAIAWIDARDSAAASAAGAAHVGSSVYYVVSDDAGATFSPNRRLAANTCQCCRLGLAFAPDGVAVAFWRQVFGSDVRDFAMARLAPGSEVVRASEDDWHIDGCPHHGGDIAIDARGHRHLAWFTGSGKAPGLFHRRVDGKRMTTPMAFGDADAQAGHPAVFARDERVHLAWREFRDGAFRLMTTRSDDGGLHWSSAREIAQAAGNADLPLFVSGTPRALLYWNTAAAGLQLIDLEAAR